MSRFDQVREQLLAERKEIVADLVAVDRALDALGVKRLQKTDAPAKPKRQKPKSTVADRRPSSEVVSIVKKAIEGADRPLTPADLRERTNLNQGQVGKATAYLARVSGEIRQVGTAPGKGRIPLWAPVNSKESAPEQQEGVPLVAMP